MKTENQSPNSTPILIGFSLLLIGIAQISALWLIIETILPTWTISPVLEKVQQVTNSPLVYYLTIVENQIQLIPETIDTNETSPKSALKEAFHQLLTQSPSVDRTTTIPPQTRLLSLDVTQDSIRINLSQEFTQGGGSSSMIYRVAQVLYTATSINPQGLVFLSVEGILTLED